MNDLGDYAVAHPSNVAPVLFRAMLIGVMATRYAERTGMSMDEAFDPARATWDTEWELDPAPRTAEMALDAVDSDLEHWGDEA